MLLLQQTTSRTVYSKKNIACSSIFVKIRNGAYVQEIWKDVIGFEGKYIVSNLGNVKSVTRQVKTINSTRLYKGRLLKPSLITTGYLVVNLADSGKVFQRKIHRLVAEAFLGRLDLQVNHKDLNKINNNIDNLEYVSNYENSLHAFKNGIKVGRTKMNAQQREEIKFLRKKGLLLREIGKLYNMSESGISEIVRGTTWKWEIK